MGFSYHYRRGVLFAINGTIKVFWAIWIVARTSYIC